MVFDGGFVQLGAVSDYDIITIGGKQYTVNQILDKTIIANADIKAYSNPYGSGTLRATIKKGQPIGVAYSYIKSSQSGDGRAWLMFDAPNGTSYYVPADGASTKALETQGTKTVAQEVKEEQDAKEKEEDPVSYYAKKLLLPGVLIIGGIYAVVQLGKTTIEKKL